MSLATTRALPPPMLAALVGLVVASLFIHTAYGQGAPIGCFGNTISGVCACTVSAGVATVDCTGVAQAVIPWQIPSTTSILILAANALTQVASQSFNTLTSLTVLSLQANDLTTLPSGVFAGLANLNSLVLSENPIVSLPSNIFQPLVSLQFLHIDKCSLASIPSNLFAGLSLSGLNLASNAIASLSDTTFNSPGLSSSLLFLDLSGNGISQVSSRAFQPLASLSTLDLRYNSLTQLPTVVFSDNLALTALNLEYNFLTSVGFLNSNLSNLATLTLGYNSITSISTNTFSGVTRLQYLTLNDNTLSTLSSFVFSAAPQLQQLFLGNNPWNCCSLEWLRTYAPLQDRTSVLCARPELVAGRTLTSTTGIISVCTTDAPSAPSAPTIGMVTSTSVQLSWPPSAGNAFAVDYYQVQFQATDSNSAWMIFQCPGGQLPVRLDGGSMALADCMVLSKDYFGNTFSSLSANIIGPLAPYTNYSFRVLAHSPLNGGTFSSPGASSTIARTLTSTPAQPQPPVLTAFQRSISVTILPPTPPNGVITQYAVRLLSFSGAMTTNTTAATTLSLTNLQPFSRYAVAVQAFTSAGPGPYSLYSNISTLESAPNTPQPPVLQTTTSQSLTVGWPAVTGSNANGIITAYSLLITFPNSTTVTVNMGLSLSYTLTGLQPAQNYSFAVKAATLGGVSAASPSLFATTLDAVPSRPFPPTVSPVVNNATCLNVQWQLPAQPNGAITQYDLHQWFNSTFVTLVATFPGTTLATTVCNLQPASFYNFSVRAYTALGASLVSIPSTGRTIDAPAFGTQVAAYSARKTSLNISWLPPTTYTGDIVNYELYHVRTRFSVQFYPTREDPTITMLYSGNATNFNHDGLQPATRYSHVVIAYTSAGTMNVTTVTDSFTLTEVPTRPGMPQVLMLDSSTAGLSWTYPLNPNGNITQFAIFSQLSNQPLVVVPGNTNAATVSGLKKDTTYLFTVAAFTSAGMGEMSRASSITTGSSDPSYTQTIVIVVTVGFVAILSIGYAYERSRHSLTRQVAPHKQQQGLEDENLVPDQRNQSGSGRRHSPGRGTPVLHSAAQAATGTSSDADLEPASKARASFAFFAPPESTTSAVGPAGILDNTTAAAAAAPAIPAALAPGSSLKSKAISLEFDSASQGHSKGSSDSDSEVETSRPTRVQSKTLLGPLARPLPGKLPSMSNSSAGGMGTNVTSSAPRPAGLRVFAQPPSSAPRLADPGSASDSPASVRFHMFPAVPGGEPVDMV